MGINFSRIGLEPCFFRDIGERSVPIVLVKVDSVQPGYEKAQVPAVVIVRKSGGNGVLWSFDSGLGGNVLKSSIAVVVEELIPAIWVQDVKIGMEVAVIVAHSDRGAQQRKQFCSDGIGGTG